MKKRQLHPKIKLLVEALLHGAAETTPALRQAVAARAKGEKAPPGEIPEELSGFIDRVAERPAEISDEDFAALKARGYTEDQLFEITSAAALGAALARLEAGLLALKKGR